MESENTLCVCRLFVYKGPGILSPAGEGDRKLT